MIKGTPSRVLWALAGLLALLIALPLVADRYLLSVMILVLYFAFVGQAWNIMMGFCGQLSLGHSLYVGLGAYASAALYQHFSVSPWLGLVVAVLVCVVVAAMIGWLAFRFGISGTYFALLTIAFSEFTRIGFDHFNWVGGSGGFFLRVVQGGGNDWVNLRGTPTMFYYLALGLAVIAFLLSAALLRHRLGFYFRAIRDNEDAARAAGVDTFRYKMYAIMISAALTSLAGVFFAFYYNNLYPEQIFNMGRSIEIILAPIIGGVGTLFGPVIGAALLTLLSEGITETLRAMDWELPGVKQILYGVALGVVIMFMPHGIWPGLARRLGLGQEAQQASDAASDAAMDRVRDQTPDAESRGGQSGRGGGHG